MDDVVSVSEQAGEFLEAKFHATHRENSLIMFTNKTSVFSDSA